MRIRAAAEQGAFAAMPSAMTPSTPSHPPSVPVGDSMFFRGSGHAQASWTLSAVRTPELMDDPALPEADHLEALTALRRINGLSFTAARLAAAVARLSRNADRLTVVDVACGGGDVTVDLARRLAAGRGRAKQLSDNRTGGRPHDSLHVIGVDISGRAVERARTLAADRGVPMEFTVHDVVTAGCPTCDVAVSSLFLHHLDDDVAVAVLRAMAAAARRGIVISDLIRSRLGLALAVLGTTVLARSRVARIDGPLSVRAARTPDEYGQLLAAAGLAGATVRRTWPERVLIVWSRPQPPETPT